MPTEIIIFIAALVVAWIVFKAVLGLLKTAMSTVVAIVVIVVILNFFGITPEELIREITNLPQTLMRLFPDAQTQIGI